MRDAVRFVTMDEQRDQPVDEPLVVVGEEGCVLFVAVPWDQFLDARLPLDHRKLDIAISNPTEPREDAL